MPVALQKKDNFGNELVVWKIKEKTDFFREQLDLSDHYLELLSKVPKLRRNQWLASRYLLNLLKPHPSKKIISKDAFGKPFYEDSPLLCSVSHSENYVAAIVGAKKVGIDIQIITQKIKRLAGKFIHDSEYQIAEKDLDLISYLHFVWGAKEAMYKAYGRKGLSFKENIRIDGFEPTKDGYHNERLHNQRR